MKSYHYLMQLGHMFNAMVKYSRLIILTVKELGKQGLISFVRESIFGRWLERDIVLNLHGPAITCSS
jgi:hypothetical protein